jgi:hypothetical protein
VDDLLAALGVLVMIEQEVVLWSASVYQLPTVGVFYAEVLSNTTMIWYVPPSYSYAIHTVIYVSCSPFRLARGSILASIIRIMRIGPLRVGALYASGLFVVFYILIIAQFLWVCEVYVSIEPHQVGYISFFGSTFVSCSRCYEPCSPRIPTCLYKTQVAIVQITGESHSARFIRLNHT